MIAKSPAAGPLPCGRRGLVVHYVSQFYEWLPWNKPIENEVPKTVRQKKEFMRKYWMDRDLRRAERYRPQLIARYGQAAGAKVKRCEAYEVCEYGAKLTNEKRKLLFGMM